MFDLVVVLSMAFLAILVIVIGWVVISREGESELEKQLKLVTFERDFARHQLALAEKDNAWLAGELSKAKNTLALSQTDEAAAKKTGEPVKAKTAAEVRKAVERRNAEEMEKHE
jgi:hypothetical protein